MKLAEEKVQGERIFDGAIVRLEVDQVRLPNGENARREVVYHPGGVAVLALDGQKMVTLVRQFRYPIGQELLELPAGKLDPGEEHALAAARELSEETGLEAGEMTYLGNILVSPGFCTERLHMYLARDLVRKGQHLDEDEFLDVVTMPFDRLTQLVMDGEIEDAKTVACVLKTKVLLGL